MKIPLPHSEEYPYNTGYWSNIVHNLNTLLVDSSPENLSSVLIKFIRDSTYRKSHSRNIDDLAGLLEILKERPNFCAETLNTIVQSALNIPELFPEKSLEVLEPNIDKIIELSPPQIHCLLSHQFFCTIKSLPNFKTDTFRGHIVGDPAPTGPLTFQIWLMVASNATRIYLNSLINYFEFARDFPESLLPIMFERKALSSSGFNWSECESSILSVDVAVTGRIGDEEMIEVDFANKDVGFGTTGTQEELLLGISPEFCPVVLVSPRLHANECVVMRCAHKFGDYVRYLREAEYTGPFPDSWDWSKRSVIAIDAIHSPGNLKSQLEKTKILRELNKAFCGFSTSSGKKIATGHWGCGAFGGDKELKFVIQLLAASAANVSYLKFHCFSDDCFKTKAEKLLNTLSDKKVKDVFQKLLFSTNFKGSSIFNCLIN